MFFDDESFINSSVYGVKMSGAGAVMMMCDVWMLR